MSWAGEAVTTCECWEERAAIIEECTGMRRFHAELQALEERKRAPWCDDCPCDLRELDVALGG